MSPIPEGGYHLINPPEVDGPPCSACGEELEEQHTVWRDGTYLLDIDWDDTACFMTVVRRVSDDPNWKPEEQE